MFSPAQFDASELTSPAVTIFCFVWTLVTGPGKTEVTADLQNPTVLVTKHSISLGEPSAAERSLPGYGSSPPPLMSQRAHLSTVFFVETTRGP